MKKKIFYMVILICGMSVFSAARYTGRSCDKKATTYRIPAPVCTQKKVAGELGFDLLLQRFL